MAREFSPGEPRTGGKTVEKHPGMRDVSLIAAVSELGILPWQVLDCLVTVCPSQHEVEAYLGYQLKRRSGLQAGPCRPTE